MDERLTTQRLKEKTGISQMRLNYLIYMGKLDGLVLRRGRGRERMFKPEAIQFINSWLKNLDNIRA